MKMTLYMAISADGYVAKKNGDSDWVSEVDTPIFKAKIAQAGCIIVGRKTFDQFPDLYPVNGVTNIVVTRNTARTSDKANVVFTNESPEKVIQLAKDRGHDKALIVGGGTTNGMFLKEGLVDEIFLDVHPLILGGGIKLFENCETDARLNLLEVKPLKQGLVLLHYEVGKS